MFHFIEMLFCGFKVFSSPFLSFRENQESLVSLVWQEKQVCLDQEWVCFTCWSYLPLKFLKTNNVSNIPLIPSIHPSSVHIICTPLNPLQGRGGAGAYPSWLRAKAGDTLDRSPVYRRAIPLIDWWKIIRTIYAVFHSSFSTVTIFWFSLFSTKKLNISGIWTVDITLSSALKWSIFE